MESGGSKSDGNVEIDIAATLSSRGWALFDLKHLELTEQETQAMVTWEEVFGSAFNLDHAQKEVGGVYRVDQGVSVGYRMDSEREFFESRLSSTSLPDPNFPGVLHYATTVQCLYSIFSKIARQCIEEVARSIGLDAQAFLDLTDIDCAGMLPESPPSKGSPEFGTKELIPTLSSSLLRICKYKSDAFGEEGVTVSDHDYKDAASNQNCPAPLNAPRKNVWFGAHTDSSFLTISLCSMTPGLDIVDQKTNSWVCPERESIESIHRRKRKQPVGDGGESLGATVFASVDEISHAATTSNTSASNFAIVFVGEFLQVLTKNRFRAAVHRVRNFSTESRPSAQTNLAHRTRISCPFIIRGRNNAVIDLHNVERYAHPGGEEALAEDKVPNLDGTSLRLLHKLLDLKRQKCFRENGSAEGSSWVLSAYPVPALPEEY